MSLIVGLKALAEEGYEVKFESHPIQLHVVAVTLKHKTGIVQRGTIPFHRFREDVVIGILYEIRSNIQKFIRVQNETQQRKT